MSIELEHKQDKRNQEAERNYKRQADFLTLVNSGVGRSQSIDNDVRKERQSRDPQWYQNDEEADLVLIVQPLCEHVHE